MCHEQLAPLRHLFVTLENPSEQCAACHRLPERNHIHAPVAEGQCMTCHVPHHSDQRYLLRTQDKVQLCSGCHEAQVGSATSFVHGATTQEGCVGCHSPHSTWLPHLLKEEGNKACLGCHEDVDHALAAPASVHQPVGEDCTGCHDPHVSDHPFQLPAETSALCVGCHQDQDPGDRPSVHGAELGCLACHQPHASRGRALLAAPGDELCLSCHQDFERRLAQGAFVHTPVTQGCATCHDPHGAGHGGGHGFLLKEGARRCDDCHADHAVRTPARSPSAQAPSGAFHGAFDGDEDCRRCHLVHSAPHPQLLSSVAADQCLECHAQPLTAPDGSTVLGFEQDLLELPVLHLPFEQGDCGACHDPHASPAADLLRGSYPTGIYAPFDEASYSLCFLCHDPTAFTTAETTTLTRFRDGSRNLHELHVNKADKGRTCRACHLSHGSHLPGLIAESVSFGLSEVRLNYEALPTGGSCAPGCHQAVTYFNGPREFSEQGAGR